MKRTLILIATCLALAACNKAPAPAPQADAAPAADSSPAALQAEREAAEKAESDAQLAEAKAKLENAKQELAALDASNAENKRVLAEVTAPVLAPPGVFYLIEASRIETDSGITGLPAGTELKFLHDDLYETPGGQAHFAATQVTNDLNVAHGVLASEAARQHAVNARVASEGAAASARAKAEAMATPTPYEATSRTGNAADPNPLNRATDPINTTHSSTKDKVYNDARGTYWKDITGKHHYFQ